MSTQPEPSRNPNTESTGFDTMLGKLVIDHGFVTNEELQQCNNELTAARKEGKPGTLRDSLISNEFVTKDNWRGFARSSTTRCRPRASPATSSSRNWVWCHGDRDARASKPESSVAIKILPKRFPKISSTSTLL